jgi:hypothetical protein
MLCLIAYMEYPIPFFVVVKGQSNPGCRRDGWAAVAG